MSLIEAQLETYQTAGYLLVPGLLSSQEAGLLRQVAVLGEVGNVGRAAEDSEGRGAKLNLWDHAGDDMFGAIASSPRVVERCEAIVGEEVYHWHSKMMLKDPGTGAWEWHQDYGYWYDACLYPRFASCFIAVHPATRRNGCLQVLHGSQHAGRLDHGVVNGQTGADPSRVEQLLTRHERVYVEMAPGDALFFHPNLLHRSDANHSENPRWALICCYNARSNSRFDGRADAGHPPYTPLAKVPDSAILERGLRDLGRLQRVS